MEMQSLAYIPFLAMRLNPIHITPAKIIDKYGFAFLANEYGLEKYTKTELSIYDIIKHKDTPNILLLCPYQELYNWYRILVTDLGMDFKILAPSSDALVFFSETTSNLYIMTPESYDLQTKKNRFLTREGNPVLWDLVVVDEEKNVDGVDYDAYGALGFKTDKFLFIASMPFLREDDKQKAISLIDGVLDSESRKNYTQFTLTAEAFGLDTAKYSLDSPIIRYFNPNVYSGEVARKVEVLDYTYNSKVLAEARRFLDLKTGIPLYVHRGNVFEEYDLAERSIYAKPIYNDDDIATLRQVDNKLDVFLSYVEQLYPLEDFRIIVYCIDDKTTRYLHKALKAVFPNSQDEIVIGKGNVYSTKDVLRKFKANDRTNYPKIILSNDSLGSAGEGLDRITHIFNYELPINSSLLEQRMLRHGAANENSRKFIVFSDTNGLFDSKMLSCAIISHLYKSFPVGLPTRNIMFDLPNISNLLAKAVFDLLYINSYAKEVENCFDLIKRFIFDYGVFGKAKIDRAAELADASMAVLDRILKMFGIDIDSVNNLEEKEIEQQFTEILSHLQKSLLYLDENGRINAVNGDELNALLYNNEYQNTLNYIETSEEFDADDKVKGLLAQHIGINQIDNEFRDALNEYNATMKFAILYGMWKYSIKQHDVDFSEFIKVYNEGVN